MQRSILITLFSLVFVCLSRAQEAPLLHCGQQGVTEQLLRKNPALKQYHEATEQQLQRYQLARRQAPATTQRTTAVVTLPVVVHIIHSNGAENIPDAQVLAALQHLNEAFANTGYYDPANGVNTQIQFCLAQRDPNNNPTNGITRDLSPYTVMGGPEYYTDDQAVKNLNRWNPSCYINIWLVRSIPGSVAGYAYLPSAHGSYLDGIVMEANWFGSSPKNSVVTIHEMGHYLGLYHTFEGACKNDDCTADGDRVCDTPPDQSTAAVGCNTSVNSCSTDALSGFGSDVSDLKEDYMDYGNFDCMKVFTQGQADRMNWFIQNVRSSLLKCKSCMVPCPAPVTAGFTSSATAVTTGTPVNFTNASINAGTYAWYLNNVLQSTSFNYTYTFNVAGTYTIKLVAHSSNPLCDSAVKTEIIKVTCPVAVHFTPPDTTVVTNTTLNFTNATTGATTYSWLLNGVVQSTALNFSHTFTTPGNYTVKLKASNGFCSDSLTRTVVVTGPCVQQNFQKTYGGQRNDYATDVRPTPDGGYIVAGRTASFGSGNDDGYLIKMDNMGVIQWSKVYGGTANDGFTRVLVTNDGGYIAAGQTRSYGFPTGAAWIVKIDATGAIQWSRQFGENTANGESVSNLIQASDGSYVITGRHNGAPSVGNVLVIRLDISGNLLWGKVYDDSDSDNGSAVLEDNGGFLIAGTSRATTWHDAFLMKLDPANGNVLWSRKYDVDGRNNFGGTALYRKGNEYLLQMTTLNDFTNVNTGRTMIVGIDLNGQATDVKEIIAPDYMLNGSGMFALTADGGMAVLHNEDNGNGDFNLIKFNAAGVLEWARKYPITAVQTNTVLRITPDGGFISSGYSLTAPGNYDMHIVKTDIQGNIPGCASSNLQASIQRPPFATNTFSWWLTRNTLFGSNTVITVQAGNSNTQTNPLCAGSPCVTPPAIDTCKTTTFVKLIGSNGRENATDIKTTAGGDLIIAGGVTGHKTGADRDALLIKVNREGTIIWQKAFGSPENDLFSSLLMTADDCIVTLGQFNSHFLPDGSLHQEHLVSKFDQQGNMIWSKWMRNNIIDPLESSMQHMHALIETSDSGIVISFSSYYANKFFLAKLAKDGTLAWFKTIVAPNGLSNTHHFTTKGDTVFLSVTDDAIVGNAKALLLLFNHRTGNPITGKRFTSLEAPSFVILQMEQAATGFAASAALTDQWGTFRTPALLQLDFNGNLLSAVKIPELDKHYNPTLARDPTFMSLTNQARDSNIVCRITPEGLPKWSYRYKVPGNTQTTANIALSPDQGAVVAGTVNSATTGNDIFLVKTSQNGIAPACFFNNVPLTTQPTPLQITSYIPGTYNFVNYQIDNQFYNEFPVNLSVTNICDSTAGLCNVLSITGTDSSCNLTDTLDFIANKNKGCGYSVDWIVDTSLVKIIAVTDSTIRLLPKQYGKVPLTARIKMPCAQLSDTLDIYIFAPSGTLNLGPDVQLCNISTYALKAGTGFLSYQWQDGSTDSTFTAYGPGMYHVLATDYCGNHYRDTVMITQAPPVAFDLGPDRTICDNDTITLTAPAGFTNYRWSGDYKINPVYGQTIRIFTDQDTLYSVTAEKGPGCLVIDTIRVKVNQTTPIHLGNDTSFCQSKSIVLDAGTGFSTYTWNTGANTQQITAGTAGSFWIAATNSNGCTSRDTLNVTALFPLPVVDLGKDTIICVNKTVVFNAGAGFTAYQWQDGSTNNTFTASQPGIYWVQVTNAHTCTNADTVEITGFKASPDGFLPDNDQLCEGQRLELKPLTSFPKYQWYNNATSPTIIVTTPGTYWLTATNSDGCSGTDSIIVVSKDCRSVLHLPNAFSPNNDRNNDLFKPTYEGFLETFRLTVYNRWGERIFETTDANRGWDGTYKGKPQDTGSFVWTCQYKFFGANQAVKQEKGVITLVR